MGMYASFPSLRSAGGWGGGGDSDHQPPKGSRVGEWISEAALNLLNLILLGTLCPQVEKERELELGEKLNEQRKILEGEHAEALRGKEKMHLEGCGPDSSVPPAELTGTPIFPSHPPLVPNNCHFRTGVCRVLRLVLLGL